MTIRCAIIGATGYTGGELVDLVLCHPDAELVSLFGSPISNALEHTHVRTIDTEFSRLRNRCDMQVQPYTLDALTETHPDAVFLCTPHEVSANLVPEVLSFVPTVFDLSGAYRLSDTSQYPVFYGFEHAHPDLVSRAVYGLVEANRDAIRDAHIVAVPGCYPTSVILPTLPLSLAGAFDQSDTVIVDSISGMSGAGRSATRANLFCEVSAGAYNVLRHRHQPEMCEHARVGVRFTPHIAPYDRGIVSTIHATLAHGWDEQRVRQTLESTYANEHWIRLHESGSWPRIGDVVRTNYCDIALTCDGDHLVLCSAIDNLLKGASGQAIQCMNVRFGCSEIAGFQGGAP